MQIKIRVHACLFPALLDTTSHNLCPRILSPILLFRHTLLYIHILNNAKKH